MAKPGTETSGYAEARRCYETKHIAKATQRGAEEEQGIESKGEGLARNGAVMAMMGYAMARKGIEQICQGNAPNGRGMLWL